MRGRTRCHVARSKRTLLKKGILMTEKKLVVVTNKIEDEAMKMICEVAPEQLEVVSVADLTRLERQGDYSRADELDGLLARAEVVYTLKPPERLLERAPGLKWIGVVSALASVPGPDAADLLKWIHSRASDELKIRCLEAMEQQRRRRADG